MKKLVPGLIAGTAALALGTTVLQPASAEPGGANPEQRDAVPGAGQAHRPDNLPGPLTKKQDRNKAKALAMLRNGSAELEQQREGATVQLAEGEYVEFPIEKTDKVFTILSEFGGESSGRFGRTPGPLHNEIEQPDPAKDNSTHWVQGRVPRGGGL